MRASRNEKKKKKSSLKAVAREEIVKEKSSRNC